MPNAKEYRDSAISIKPIKPILDSIDYDYIAPDRTRWNVEQVVNDTVILWNTQNNLIMYRSIERSLFLRAYGTTKQILSSKTELSNTKN